MSHQSLGPNMRSVHVVCGSPFDAQPGGQVGSVSIRDVGVLPQKRWDLLVGVQSDPSGHQYRPVLITPQLDVVRSLSILLELLGHG